MEETRRESKVDVMQDTRRAGQTDPAIAEDLAHGQIVIITFRWLIIVGALVSTLWTLALPDANITRQTLVTFLLLVYAVVNFLLLARYLRKSQSLPGLTYSMSLVDLILITLVIAIQPDIFESYVYVYYYPALMVLAVAFPASITAGYTIGAIAIYGLMVSFSAGADLEQVFSRLLIMGSVAFCASLFRKIEHDRRAGKSRIFSLGDDSAGRSS